MIVICGKIKCLHNDNKLYINFSDLPCQAVNIISKRVYREVHQGKKILLAYLCNGLVFCPIILQYAYTI